MRASRVAVASSSRGKTLLDFLEEAKQREEERLSKIVEEVEDFFDMQAGVWRKTDRGWVRDDCDA